MVLHARRGKEKEAASLAAKGKALRERMGLADLERRDGTQVSGGQLQRAGIGRALMDDPEIIFGDEPTGALNSKSTAEVMEILTKINGEGTAILLVTHDATVAAYAHRVLFRRAGQIAGEYSFGKQEDAFDPRPEKLGF